MEQQDIIFKTLEVFKKCEIRSFPVDCLKIIKGLNIPLYKYSELTDVKAKRCLQISNDAFTLQGVIFYNDNFPHKERQRFSLMHEVGHIILEHIGTKTENEKEADYFASNILAPRALIRYLECNTVKGIYNTFSVSCMAANRILDDYIATNFWKNKKLHMSICDWFFPSPKVNSPVQRDHSHENYEAFSDFLKIHYFLMGEEYVFEQSEFRHLHGYDF